MKKLMCFAAALVLTATTALFAANGVDKANHETFGANAIPVTMKVLQIDQANHVPDAMPANGTVGQQVAFHSGVAGQVTEAVDTGGGVTANSHNIAGNATNQVHNNGSPHNAYIAHAAANNLHVSIVSPDAANSTP